MAFTAKQNDDTKGRIACFKLDNKTYIFLSFKILTNSTYVSSI